jgi:hypothetical protein
MCNFMLCVLWYTFLRWWWIWVFSLVCSSYIIKGLVFWLTFDWILLILNAITICVLWDLFYWRNGHAKNYNDFQIFSKQILKQDSKWILLTYSKDKLDRKNGWSSSFWSLLILSFVGEKQQRLANFHIFTLLSRSLYSRSHESVPVYCSTYL